MESIAAHPSHFWEKAAGSARDVEVYNLDRRPFVLTTLSMLAAASDG